MWDISSSSGLSNLQVLNVGLFLIWKNVWGNFELFSAVFSTMLDQRLHVTVMTLTVNNFMFMKRHWVLKLSKQKQLALSYFYTIKSSPWPSEDNLKFKCISCLSSSLNSIYCIMLQHCSELNTGLNHRKSPSRANCSHLNRPFHVSPAAPPCAPCPASIYPWFLPSLFFHALIFPFLKK